MAEIISENIYLILFLPFWVFLVIMLGRFFSVYINKTAINTLTLLSSGMGAFVSLYLYRLYPADMVYENTFPFIKINDFVIFCGIHIDKLALIFLSILFLVSFFVQIFSIYYMKDEKKYYRFFALLNMFNFSLSALFLSPNLYQTYVFWEIAAIISYLLIGFEYLNPDKSLASKKVFIINRIGDTAFLGGIIICSYLLYEYAPSKSLVSLSFLDINTISLLISAYTSQILFALICGLFIIAAMVKSAQFPFYTWLQDAMEAKLPVSALLHSATLVSLGVYLIIRLFPLFSLESVILKGLIIIGVLTALICSLSACAQNNPKKILAYSTSAQLGLMFFAVGIFNIKAAIILFCAHAVIKSLLFITLPNENEKWNLFKFAVFIISGLSLSGILFSGMVSKEIFAYNLNNPYKIILAGLTCFTAFYIIRTALLLADKNKIEKYKTGICEIISISALLGLNIVLYFIIRKIGHYHITELFWMAISVCIFTYVLYIKKSFFKVPFVYQLCLNGFYLNKFYMTTVLSLYNKISDFSYKFDKNVLGNYKPIISTSRFLVKISHFIEIYVMNNSVNLVTELSRRISAISKQLQTKNVQWYNFYGFIIIVSVMSILVVAYAAILAYIRGV